MAEPVPGIEVPVPEVLEDPVPLAPVALGAAVEPSALFSLGQVLAVAVEQRHIR
ncbi:MAG: hypothetical protein ACOZFS_14585 [Thermodesulfobacteriota bacterium]